MTTVNMTAFTIDASATLTVDGRFGRCWLHVYAPPAAAEGPPPRVLAVDFMISREYGGRHLDEAEVAALAVEQGGAWLRQRIGQLERGKEYRVTVTREGQQRHEVTDLAG